MTARVVRQVQARPGRPLVGISTWGERFELGSRSAAGWVLTTEFTGLRLPSAFATWACFRSWRTRISQKNGPQPAAWKE